LQTWFARFWKSANHNGKYMEVPEEIKFTTNEIVGG